VSRSTDNPTPRGTASEQPLLVPSLEAALSDPAQLDLALSVLETEQARRTSRNRLAAYRPYRRQAEFHAAGARTRERLFMAGNQLGKTMAGASEWAIHLTGLYPDWWEGKRFDRPVRFWAAGVTAESTRDNPQRMLLGPPQRKEAWGTGTIPADCLLNTAAARGVADGVDSLVVRHVSGGASTLLFKSYEKGREKWQGETLDGVWFDEEPPLDIYTEGLTRTNATEGIVIVTFTPLLGMSEVVRMFLSDEDAKEMR
jgi:phage terminase large subunit-like protein